MKADKVFKHYIITRFNLRVDDWNYTKNNEVVLTEEWLDHRFLLFKNFCLPSMINQCNQNFTWLIFFDVNTPEKHRSIIHEISESYKNLHAFYIDGYEEMLPSLLSFIHKDIGRNDKYIITSRIDNDDCLHQNYIDKIQGAFDKQENCIVDIPDGYQLVLNKNSDRQIIEIRKLRNYFNPFISLIESAKNPRTIMSKMHREWRNAPQHISINNNRLWSEIIHEKNKLNAVKPLERIAKKIDYDAFSLTQTDFETNNSMNIFISNLSIEMYRFYYIIKGKTPRRIKNVIKSVTRAGNE